MTALIWDKVGERFFQTGVDRGVLYKPDGLGVAWNGLTSVEESSEKETKRFYLDGVKYQEYQDPGDYIAKLKAFTYPDEFDAIMGIKEFDTGLLLHDQPASSFGLSYRTRIGNDNEGTNYGYEVHIIWQILAVPDSVPYSSIGDAVEPIEFGWSLSATPQKIPGYRPTAHVSFRSMDVDPAILSYIEDILYGTDTTEPTLPSLSELFVALTDIIITDNGDGTWTAEGPISNVMMTGPSIFFIDAPSVVYLDANLYEISSCSLG